MNRQERKRQLAESKKKSQWYKNLMPWQKEYIDEVVFYQKELSQMQMISNLDTALTGALVEKTDFTLEEIFEMNVLVAKYIGELKNMENKMGVEERIMSLKSIEKEAINKIDDMLRAGKKKTEIIKSLRETYKGTGATTAEYNAAYKNRLEEFEKEEAAKKILEIMDTPDKVNDEVIEYNFDEEKVVNNSVVCDEVEADHEEEEFEILKEVRIIDLKGKHGVYHVEKNVLEVNKELAFCGVQEIKTWASEERETLAQQIALLKSQMNKINAREDEAIKVMKKFM